MKNSEENFTSLCVTGSLGYSPGSPLPRIRTRAGCHLINRHPNSGERGEQIYCSSVQSKLVLFVAAFLTIAPLLTAAGHAQTSQPPTANQPLWIKQLPPTVQSSILWSADHELGNLKEWQPSDMKLSGGGVLNTGDDAVIALASWKFAHSGRFSAAATITGAVRGQNGKRAVRLMRWTNRPWDRNGNVFPKSAFYSTWMYFPYNYNSKKYPPWDPGDGGWWNVFQFKADDDKEVSTSMYSLGAYFDDDHERIVFGLNDHVGEFQLHEQSEPIALPIGKWFHVEAQYVASAEKTGSVIAWQDGVEIFRLENVQTALTTKHENAIWGIGNYTDHISGGPVEGEATIYFDDAVVATERISAHLPEPGRANVKPLN